MSYKSGREGVNRLRAGRKPSPLMTVPASMMFMNFHLMRFASKLLSRRSGGYGPSPISPVSEEGMIDYRDMMGWDPLAKEMRELLRVIGPVIRNEVVVWEAVARSVRTRHLSVTTKRKEPDFWEEMEDHAKSMRVGMVGYTRLNSDYIFQGCRVLYPNLIVLGMEMRWPQMSQSPGLEQSVETMSTYADLGNATNKVADFLVARGYRAQPLPPYSMFILWTATAKAAGLAEKGLHGLMISPEYGPLQRWSVVATDAEPLPEKEPVKMDWLPEYCASCGLCIRACPAGAVLEKPIKRQGEFVTHVDNEKCYPYFAKYRGCSICIKVCAERLRKEGLVARG